MPPRKKGKVFRVTGLRASQTDDELDKALKATIYDNLEKDEEPKLTVAIVPSCYSDEEKVALVEFHDRVPAFLSPLLVDPLGDWQDEMDGGDISFDQHFFDFTQLYTPKPGSPVTADIIAITGLDGNAYGSWRGKGNLGRMWLRHFLSEDLPCCRTMIYGYNSKLSTHGVDTIMDYGRGLIEEIKKVRNTEELRKRPLFFIAHSFGGIILAHCLVKAVQTDEDDHPTITSLHRATYGMLLFGIPHKGLIIDDIQKMVAGQDNSPRSALIEQIRSKSDVLAFQLVDFRNLIRDRRVVSFYETGQTRQLEFDSESRRWKRTGDYVTKLDADSALLHLPDSTEDKIPLDADHSMMVKFDTRNNRGYTSARDKLKQFEKDAPSVVAARFLRAQNRPEPSLMVPSQRDGAFVGREDIMVKIGEKFKHAASRNHSRVALVGLGGIGKSQIAIEYAYRVREFAPHTWVFWVHASNIARFTLAYTNIAAKVELPGRDNPKVDILSLVYNWLCDERNGQWLMILDNADDDDVFFSANEYTGSTTQTSEATGQKRSLGNFLPQTPNGSILITSRNSTAAYNLVGAQGSIVKVEPMSEDDALALLKTRVSISESDEGDAKELVQALELIPLAITHAAAYIKTRAPVTTISSYLGLFQESESNQTRLLDTSDLKDLRRDPTTGHAVITTLQISFNQIQKTGRAAAELLALMSMFDRQGIPVFLLQNEASQLDFEDALAPLLSFSLVRAEIGQQSFEMHRLVQLSMRTWLNDNSQLDRWKTNSIAIIATLFPSGEYETWADCQLLIPHAKEALRHEVHNEDNMLMHANVAKSVGWYLYHRGEYVVAEKVSQAAADEYEKVLGVEHPDTLASVSNLGSVLSAQGRYKEAEVMYQQALKRMEKVLGVEHPHTLTSVSNLGLVLLEQGKYKEAEVMHQRALKGNKKVLGVEHPQTLTSISNMASTLWRQKRWKEAEDMKMEVLKGRQRVLGHEHPDTLQAMDGLALTLKSQSRDEEAISLMARCAQLREQVLGRHHPDTEDSLETLEEWEMEGVEIGD